MSSFEKDDDLGLSLWKFQDFRKLMVFVREDPSDLKYGGFLGVPPP